MKKQAAQIKEFHEFFGFNVHSEPQIPSAEVITLRDNLIREEVDELLEASKNGDIVEAADAIGDILYVLLGTACEYGLIDMTEEIFDLIHTNNMKKVWPDGTVHKREDGKVIKPEGFEKVALSTLFEKFKK